MGAPVPVLEEYVISIISFFRPWLLLFLFAVPIIPVLRRFFSGGEAMDRRQRAVVILRMIIIFLLALAAAGPGITAPSDKVETMFVLDVSDSMGSRGAEDGLAMINAFLGGMKGDDSAGLVTVSSDAVTEIPSRPGGAPFEAGARHDGGRSRLSEGLYAAAGSLFAASLSGEGESRIVLVSDGRSTDGSLEEAARFARRSGITIDTLPAGPPPGKDVLVRELTVPARIPEGEVHDLSVLIHAEQSTAARLVILKNGEYIGEDRLQLIPGEQRRIYNMPAADAGTVVYEVILDSAVDAGWDNNRGLAVLTVEGPPRVLWVGQGKSTIPEALALQGMGTDRVLPGNLPDSFSALSAWDAVILDNVSSRDLSLKTLDLLESWVRTRGGGLMMIGGDASFGLGAYQGTPVERTLPVDMDSPSSLYIPSLSMVMVIDKSGSMSGKVGGGKTKQDIVKDAVLGAVEVLNPLYTFGVAAFDADVEWTIPLTEAGNESEIRSGLAGLQSGGGTILYPAIREAYERLVQSPSAVRHLVILSDGLAEPADYGTLAEAIARDGITVSTVAVGKDADSELMESLAEEGDGRYWYAEDATEVPRIFASESMIVSRGLVVEETVFPVPVTPAEALDGIDLSLMPPLHGYVMTYPNPLAVEALRSPRGHPLLVYGNHGLGRSVAFTSDLRGSWGRDWVSWDQFPRFIAQSVRWMRRNPGAADTTLTMHEEGGEIRIVLEARTEDGGYRSDLRPVGTLSGPDQRETAVILTQTAPGRYEGGFQPGENGIYRTSVRDEAAGLGIWSYWTQAYSPELWAPGIDTAALAEAARVGGGRLLTGLENPKDWWTVRDPQQKTLADLTLVLALIALILFLVDIALREVPGMRREEPDMEELILRGIDDERHKPKYIRPTPAEAARILAERRVEREKNQKNTDEK